MACQEERAEIAVTLVQNGANLHVLNKVRVYTYTTVGIICNSGAITLTSIQTQK